MCHAPERYSHNETDDRKNTRRYKLQAVKQSGPRFLAYPVYNTILNFILVSSFTAYIIFTFSVRIRVG